MPRPELEPAPLLPPGRLPADEEDPQPVRPVRPALLLPGEPDAPPDRVGEVPTPLPDPLLEGFELEDDGCEAEELPPPEGLEPADAMPGRLPAEVEEVPAAGLLEVERVALVARAFEVEELREAVLRPADPFERPLAAAERFGAEAREADAFRDLVDAFRDLVAAARDFDAFRGAALLLDFEPLVREALDRLAELFFEPARLRLDEPPDFFRDELPERPLEEPRLVDAITTPFDVSALLERIDR